MNGLNLSSAARCSLVSRRIASLLVFTSAVFLILILATCPAAGQEEIPRVTDIEFRGTFTASSDYLMRGLRTRVGRPLDLRLIDEDMKSLFEEGRFVATRVETEPYQDGVRVIFHIQENPTCWRVEFKGKGVSARKLREQIALRPGSAATQHVLRSDEQKIADYLKSRGYAFAKVTRELSLVTEGGEQGAVVTFVVDRGPKTVVRAIHFQGVQGVKPSKLRKAMATKVDRWWTSRRYVESVFQTDLDRVRLYYRDRGWLDVMVEAAEPEFIKDGAQVELTIRVTEGPRYVLRDVSFSGLVAVPRDELLAEMRLKAGEPFSWSELQKDVRRLERTLADKGFPNAVVDPQMKFALEGDAVDLAIDISEGEKVQIDRIEVVGNYKTKKLVILREMAIDPGDQYDRLKVEASAQRLRETRFFEKVNIQLVDTDPPEPGRKNLLVEVEEANTGRLTGGVGYSTVTEFAGIISFEQDNFDWRDTPPTARDWLTPWRWFQGDGQKFRISLSPGSQRDRYEVFFMEPWLMDRPVSLSLNAYFTESRYFEDYTESRMGFRGALGKRYENGFFMEGALRTDRVRMINVPWDAIFDVLELEGTNWINGLEFTLGLRRTDSRMLPSRGYNAEARLELDGKFLGSDFDIWKSEFLGQWYHTLHENMEGGKHILGLEGRLSLAGAYGQSGDVPIFERYFAGGATVRGFSPRELGPRGERPTQLYPYRDWLFWLPERFFVEDSDQPAGGKFLVSTGIEYGFPILRDDERQMDTLRGLVFFDAGTLGEDLFDESLGKIRTSVGFGLRLLVPALGNVPIRLDIGFPITKEPEDDTQLLFFSMGAFF